MALADNRGFKTVDGGDLARYLSTYRLLPAETYWMKPTSKVSRSLAKSNVCSPSLGSQASSLNLVRDWHQLKYKRSKMMSKKSRDHFE